MSAGTRTVAHMWGTAPRQPWPGHLRSGRAARPRRLRWWGWLLVVLLVAGLAVGGLIAWRAWTAWTAPLPGVIVVEDERPVGIVHYHDLLRAGVA